MCVPPHWYVMPSWASVFAIGEETSDLSAWMSGFKVKEMLCQWSTGDATMPRDPKRKASYLQNEILESLQRVRMLMRTNRGRRVGMICGSAPCGITQWMNPVLSPIVDRTHLHAIRHVCPRTIPNQTFQLLRGRVAIFISNVHDRSIEMVSLLVSHRRFPSTRLLPSFFLPPATSLFGG